MPQQFINLFYTVGLLVMFILQGCSVTPTTEDETATASITVPAEVRVEFNRAVEMLKSGQRSIALQLFQHLAQSQPQLAGVQVNLGIIYLQEDKPAAAIAALKRAIQLNPSNATAHHHLGIAYRQSGQFNAAKLAYLQALKLNPDYANAHLNLAILYDLYLQQLDKALEYYKQFQRLSAAEDKQVAKWLIDVERRVTAATKAKGDGGS